eukprot:6022319-Pyramimonas_sp.AAC.1
MASTIPGIVNGYQWPDSGDVVDLGGGTGDLLNQVALARPGCTCHLLDLRPVVEEAKQAGIVTARNVNFSPCDFFQVLPVRADLVIMKRILHNWDDGRCAEILRNVAASGKPNLKVLVIDFVITSAPNTFDEMLRQDIHMQLVFSGQERTLDEFNDIFQNAGFSKVCQLVDFHGGPYKGMVIEPICDVSGHAQARA